MGKPSRAQRVRSRGWETQTQSFQEPGPPKLRAGSVIPDKAKNPVDEHCREWERTLELQADEFFCHKTQRGDAEAAVYEGRYRGDADHTAGTPTRGRAASCQQ